MRKGRLGAVLVAAGVLAGCAANGMWLLGGTMARLKGSGVTEEQPKLNFAFDAPGRPFFANPAPARASSLSIVRFDPNVVFSIVAEEGEDQTMDSGQLARLAEGHLRKAATALQVEPVQAVTLAGQPAAEFWANGEVEGRPRTFVYRTLAHNGFLYQLITNSSLHDAAELKPYLIDFYQRFRLLDPTRVSSRVKVRPLREYASAWFGYHLKLTSGATWGTWEGVAKSVEEAETGGLHGNKAAFAVVPLRFVAGRPPLTTLRQVALAALGFDHDDASVKALDSPHESMPGVMAQTWSAARSVDGEHWDYRLRILSTDSQAWFVWVWAGGEKPPTQALADQVFASMTIDPRPLAADGQAPPAPLPERLATAQVWLINQLGLAYQRQRQRAVACDLFVYAQGRAPDRLPYLLNALECLNRQGAHADAAALVEGAPAELKQEPQVRSWYAWHVASGGDKQRGAELFQQLFATGYKDDGDFVAYMSVLEDLNQVDAAVEAWEGYLALRPSIPLRQKMSAFLFRVERHQQAVKMLDEQLVSAFDADLAYARVAHLEELERYSQMLEAVEDLEKRGLQSSDSWYWKGRAQYRLRWYRKAKQSFEQALTLEPQNKSLKEWRDHLSAELGQGDNTDVKRVLEPVPLPQQTRAAMDAVVPPAAQGHGVVYPWRVDALQFQRGHTFRRTVYRRVKVLDESGVTDFSTLEFSYRPLTQRVFVNELVVTDAGGAEVSRANVEDSYVLDRTSAEQTDERILHVPVPRLAPGHVLTYVVTFEARGTASELPFREYSLGASRPTALAALVYLGQTTDARLVAPNGPQAVPVANGVVFQMANPPVIPLEPWAADWRRTTPVVFLGDARGDWRTVGQKYLASIKDVLKEDGDAARRAKEVVGKERSRDQRIRLVWEDVRKAVKYRAIEFGARGLTPARPSTTLRQGYGDCKDHAVLLVQLFRTLGIEAQLALVNTQGALRPGIPSLDQFNHMVVYLPQRKGGRFLDATDKAFDPQLSVPVGLAGKQVLVLSDSPHLMTVPGYGASESRADVARDIAVDAKGLLEVEETLTLHGYAANFMRGWLATKDQDGRKKWFQRTLVSEVPGAALQESQVDALDEVTKPLKVRVRYHVRNLGTSHEDRLPLAPPLSWEKYFLEPPSVVERKSDFELHVPLEVRSITRITAGKPDGLEAVLRQPSEHSAATGSCRVEQQVDHQTGVVMLGCRIKAGVFPAATYQDHQHLAQDALSAARLTWLRGQHPGP